jgi:hypothetical protein
LTYIAPVTPSEPIAPATPLLDRRRGKEDDADRLKRHAGDAPADYLEGALDNEHLNPEVLRLLLHNRSATAEIVTRVGRNRAWMRSRDVKIAFVANPRAPVVLARQVLPHLFWRDLADVACDVRLSPAVRRDAEKVLRTRLPELSVGERTALARRPSPGIVAMMRDDLEPAVLRALAGNPRATESDILHAAARRNVPAGFLGWLATESPWGQRREVLLCVVRHPRTPHAAALRATQRLSPGDLLAVHGDEAVPRLVRVAAGRRAAEPATDSGDDPPRIG